MLVFINKLELIIYTAIYQVGICLGENETNQMKINAKMSKSNRCSHELHLTNK